MNISGKLTFVLAAVFLLASHHSAQAAIDMPAAHDARAVGMAGSGVAVANNASAIFHNPAALDLIDTFSISLVFSPTFPTATAPIPGSGAEVGSDPLALLLRDRSP